MISELLNGFLEEVEIRRIVPSRRALRNSLSSLDELMASISEKGLLHPIVVRPVESHFEVVAGMRRFEACKRLGMKKIPSHIASLDEREAYEISLIENIRICPPSF